ncbi:MAG: tetratricopeptide repeat protein [Verrucomicrobiota bacterium]
MKQEQEIFEQAMALPSHEAREAYLLGACGQNRDLRRSVDELLAAFNDAGELDFLQTGERSQEAQTVLADVRLEEGPGTVIGRYKLLQQIGEGGCGVVYLAEQEEPVRRRVALKVIKLGMDTKSVIARFEAERQALALMDHPNIAKVLDAGATDTGRPYFVMELVRGVKITEYCDEAKLSTRDRLDLFIKVCQAIQHAHQKGIIHRDLKPSNILVTLHDGVAVPKVIDFGIAKATTDQRLTDKTLFTALEQFIGTPAYMSPEQAEMSGLDIDTRCDIYSLGVLLYEMLTGKTPFNAKELLASGLDEMRRTIREQEPVRPSTKLSQTLVAANVSSLKSSGEKPATEEEVRADSRRLLRLKETVALLRGDVDWIVMKCLEKDRARRYETANGLASDIQRHLNNEAVFARPPSTAYRFQKLVRRNKVMAGAAVLVLTAILAASVISIGQALRAGRELRRAKTAEAQALAAEAKALASEAKAQTEKANAQAALHFLQDDVLNQASPGYQPDRDLKVRTLLDSIAERLDRAAERPPLVEASIRQTIGSVYTELGDYAKAVLHYQDALRLQRQHLGESHPDTLRSLYGLAMAYWWRGDMAKAEPLTGQGLEASRRVLGEKDPLTLQFMQARVFVLLYLGEKPWAELEPLFLQALALHREVLGPDDLRTLKLISGLGVGYNLNWQAAKAEPLVADALERGRRVLSERHPQTAALTLVLGYIYSNLNQPQKAEPLALQNVEVRRSLLGEEHFSTMVSVLLLARIYVQQQQFDQAKPLTEQVLNLSRRLPIENTTVMPWKLSLLAGEYLEQGHTSQADALCEVALQALRRKPDANPRANPFTITQMGAVRLAQQKYAEAESLLREASPLMEKHWPDAAYRFYVMSLLGASLAGQQKHAEAEPLLLQGFHGLQQRQASIPAYLRPTRRIRESIERLVQLYDAWGQPAKAAEWRQKLAEFEQAAKARDGGNIPGARVTDEP